MPIRIDGTNETANPGITGDDADTGFVFGTDEISIVTGGTEKVKVDNGALKVTGQSSGITDGGITFDWEDISQSGRIFAESSAASQFKFFTTNSSGTRAERMRIDDAGHVTIQDGNLVVASGHGIDFSATANSSGTMTSELLDDYEEGSFTPVLEQSTANPTNIVYSYQRGKYTKIGNVVTIWFDFNLTSFTAGNGRFRVGDLPFSSVSGADHGGYGAPNFRSSSAMELAARLNSSSAYHHEDYIDLRHINNGGSEEDTTVSGGRITGMSFYYTV